MSEGRVERRLAAILAVDVAGYSRLMGEDEEGTLAALRAVRRELGDPKIAEHRGRIVKTTGDGLLVEFASVVDAVRCAVELQREMIAQNAGTPAGRRIEFRMGINLGDILIEDGDIFGDGVNIAARLEALAVPGGICLSAAAHEQVRDHLDLAFVDLGEQQVKNITRPVRTYAVALGASSRAALPVAAPLPLPDKPSLAVLPFQNMTGDAEQEYFVDGMVEEITTAIARLPWLFVIARNSAFTYKGKPVDVKQVAQELGVRYVLEGSVRKAGNRVRITGQLIDTATGAHIWADRFDGGLDDIFELQDQVAEQDDERRRQKTSPIVRRGARSRGRHARGSRARLRGLRRDGGGEVARDRRGGRGGARLQRGGARAPGRDRAALRAERDRGGVRAAPRRGLRGRPRADRPGQGRGADLEGRGGESGERTRVEGTLPPV